jgi:hypothetical protein
MATSRPICEKAVAATTSMNATAKVIAVVLLFMHNLKLEFNSAIGSALCQVTAFLSTAICRISSTGAGLRRCAAIELTLLRRLHYLMG